MKSFKSLRDHPERKSLFFNPHSKTMRNTNLWTPLSPMRMTLGTLLATLALSAPAATGRWTQGYGQGNLEYFIDAQGMRLSIGCPTQSGSADALSSVSLQSIDSLRQVARFTIAVNGQTYTGPFAADSRVGTNNFLGLLQDLRQTDAVVRHGAQTITFPKSNAAQVLPVYGKGWSCNLG